MGERPNKTKTAVAKAKGSGETRTTKPGRNGFDPDLVSSLCEQIETVQASIDKIMANAKEECAPLREDIQALKQEAVDQDIPRQAFNAVLSERRLQRKAEAIRGKLTEKVQDDYDQLRHALGMLAEEAMSDGAEASPAA